MTTAKPAADRVPVLMYHRVGEVRDEKEAQYAVTPSRFAAQMHALQREGYRAVPVDTFVQWLDGKASLQPHDFVLTFDDGFRGVHDHALPVLRELGWPFTVFLVTDGLGGSEFWQSQVNPEGLRHPLLSATDVSEMARQGASFHSHTRRHARLPATSDAQLEDELRGSLQAIEQLTGTGRATFLAYPYGQFDERVEVAARAAGYAAAFSVQPGFNRRDAARFRLRRLDVFGTDTPAMLLRKTRFGSNDGRLAKALKYYARSVIGR